MAQVIERADQLVLNYVSAAADAAHGVLRPDQRIDFVRRLRARIEDERHGSADTRQVAKVLARFGDPVGLVQREVHRLAESAQAPEGAVTAAERAAGPGGVVAGPMVTEGRDARTIVVEHPRETLAMAVLVVAALLVPFDLPAVAIFRMPVLVWALGVS